MLSMEEESSQPLILLKQYGLVIGLLIVGLVFFIYALMQFLGKSSKDDVSFQTQDQSLLSGSSSPSSLSEIVVDIEGAVTHPGVYHLNTESRLQDVVTKAGGLVKTSDKEKIAKGLNLAEKLTDGAKVYIPFIGETTTASVGRQTVLGSSTTNNGLINVNTASSEELDSLPGVGSVTAGKMIANRPYTTIQDLVTKKAVGQAAFDKLKDKVTAQ